VLDERSREAQARVSFLTALRLRSSPNEIDGGAGRLVATVLPHGRFARVARQERECNGSDL